jgi:hypothetical protein
MPGGLREEGGDDDGEGQGYENSSFHGYMIARGQVFAGLACGLGTNLWEGWGIHYSPLTSWSLGEPSFRVWLAERL